MKYLIIFLILILIPQIFYYFKKLHYKDLKNGSRFFIKEETNLKDRTKIVLTNADGFDIYVNRFDIKNPKGCVQIVHGMLEHSLNYLDFISYLNSIGYAVIISDNRGHGKSISEKNPSGLIKFEDELIDDQVVVSKYMKMVYPDKNLYMIGHSMGSLIARNFLKENDYLIDKLILTGTVAYIPLASLGSFIGNIVCFYLGGKRRSRLLDLFSGISLKDMTWISYNEENIRIKSKDFMRLSYFLARSNVCLFNLVSGLKKNFKAKNKDLDILSLTGVDDDVTGGYKGLGKTMDILKSKGYEKLAFKEYDHMKHEILNEDEKEKVYEDIGRFLDKSN